MTSSFPIDFEPNPSTETVDAIDRGLTGYNRSQFGVDDYAPFALVVRDEHGDILAGLNAATFFGWLAIELLWVDERIRGQGYGAALLTQAEAIGRERSCHVAFLNTLSFQAPDFYAAHGYTEFGILENARIGLKRHYFQKSLNS